MHKQVINLVTLVSISGDGSYAIVGASGEDGGAGDPLLSAGRSIHL